MMKKRKPGRPKGTTGIKKTTLKPPEQKRTIRKLYEWTPQEYQRILQAVKQSRRKESDIIRIGALKEVNDIIERELQQAEAPKSGA